MSTDADEIRNLIFRYAELLDAGRFGEVGELFTDAEVDWGGDRTTGAAAVAERLAAMTRLHDDGTPRTAHLVTNVIVEVDGERAGGRSRYCVVQATDRLGLQPIVVGRYEDRFERIDRRWRFVARRYHVDLLGDLSEHLPPSLVRRLGG